MTGRGLGRSNPGVSPPGLPLGAATWAPGFWFDLITAPGADGAAIVTPTPSQAGSNVLLPGRSPLVDNAAYGGQRGAQVVDTGASLTEQYFSCDAVAPYFGPGLPWFVGTSFCSEKISNTMPVWNALSSTTTDGMQGRWMDNRFNIQYRSAATGIVTIVGSIDLTFNEHFLFADYNPATGRIRTWVDGVLDIDQALAVPVMVNLNRFTWLAGRSSVVFEGATGRARHLIMTPSSVDQAGGIATVYAYLLAQNYTLPLSASPQILYVGDSNTDTGLNLAIHAGSRAVPLQQIINNRLSLFAQGQFSHGTIANNLVAAQGGADIQTIRTLALTALAVPSCAPRYIIGMAGSGNIFTETPAVAAGHLRVCLEDIFQAAVLKNPAVQLLWSPITPFQPGFSPNDVRWQPFNDLLTQPGGEFDFFNANHPGRLLPLDNPGYLIPPNVWDAANFADVGHLNDQGNTQVGNGQWAAYGALFAALSPT
jgi:hypothetical protein